MYVGKFTKMLFLVGLRILPWQNQWGNDKGAPMKYNYMRSSLLL